MKVQISGANAQAKRGAAVDDVARADDRSRAEPLRERAREELQRREGDLNGPRKPPA
jgi:hypothetical protein